MDNVLWFGFVAIEDMSTKNEAGNEFLEDSVGPLIFD